MVPAAWHPSASWPSLKSNPTMTGQDTVHVSFEPDGTLLYTVYVYKSDKITLEQATQRYICLTS